MGLKGYVTLFAIFEKAKPFFFCINLIPKIMVQFCYLRLNLGTENLSCCLMQRMTRMDLGWNLKTLAQRF